MLAARFRRRPDETVEDSAASAVGFHSGVGVLPVLPHVRASDQAEFVIGSRSKHAGVYRDRQNLTDFYNPDKVKIDIHWIL